MANVLDISCAKVAERFELSRKCARGYMRQKGPMEQALQDKFEAMAKKCEEDLPVYGAWRTFGLGPLEDGPGFWVAGTPLELPSESLARRLEGATHAVLMAFTLGMQYEREAGRAGADGALDALIFDACASALVETGADMYEERIRVALADAGYEPTGLRFSPGYGDLSLDVQPGFLDVLDAGKNLGIYASDENLLIPAKSITAILGVRPFEDAKGDE